jgi:TLC domain
MLREASVIALRLLRQMPIGSYKISAMWMGFCIFLHLVSAFGTCEVIEGFEKRLSRYDRQDWYNRFVSIIHAFIMFVRAMCYWTLKNPSMSIVGLQNDQFGVITLDIMMGYLWYDLIIELAKNKKQFSTILHHLLGYVSLYAVRASASRLGVFYFMMVFVAEGSTPVLHTLWFMSKLKLKDTATFKMMGILLMLLFMALRVLFGPFTVWHLASNHDAWRAKKAGELDAEWLFPLLICVSVVFVSINMYWFFLLVSMAVKPATKDDKTTKAN